jgi:hypothetical protein
VFGSKNEGRMTRKRQKTRNKSKARESKRISVAKRQANQQKETETQRPPSTKKTQQQQKKKKMKDEGRWNWIKHNKPQHNTTGEEVRRRGEEVIERKGGLDRLEGRFLVGLFDGRLLFYRDERRRSEN